MQRFFWLVVTAASFSPAGLVSAAAPDGNVLQSGSPSESQSASQSSAQQPGRPVPARTADWLLVPAEQLAGKRAGADTVSNTMDLNGAVSGNSAINVVTGANAISSGAFSNASGLPVAIQNSGANVLIQNATIINVQMK